MLWAWKCVEHVLPLMATVDERLTNAIMIAREWTRDDASVGEARNASFGAIAVANELTNPMEMAVARAVGHLVATAHMADHSLRAADYALKSIKLASKSVDTERAYQDNQLPPDVRELVLSARSKTDKE
jgi:hypothetical protein